MSIAIIVKVMLTRVGDIRNVGISIDNACVITIGISVEDKPPNGGESSERPVHAKAGSIDLVIDQYSPSCLPWSRNISIDVEYKSGLVHTVT